MPFKRYSEYDGVYFTIEMHKSMWCDDLENYDIKDLFSDGDLYLNPDQLEASDDIKQKIRNGHYNIYPIHPKWYKQKNKTLSGYIYIGDTDYGMRIYHEEPVREPECTETNYTGDRYTL